MVVKRVFTVISIQTTIISQSSHKKVSQNFECKRGEPIFQVGEKEGGNQNYPQILGGEPKPDLYF